MDPEIIELMEDVFRDSLAMAALSRIAAVAAYVFFSLSLYTIAQRRRIRHPWMAWVPVVQMWILGSVSDQYRYVTKGEIRSKRVVLLVTQICMYALLIVSLAVSVSAVVHLLTSMDIMGFAGNTYLLLRRLNVIMVLMLGALAVSIVDAVFSYMALYDLYGSCDPANKVVYLVLSIIPGISTVAMPLFLFLCRNLDKGMPPRKEQTSAEPASVPEEPAPEESSGKPED